MRMRAAGLSAAVTMLLLCCDRREEIWLIKYNGFVCCVVACRAEHLGHAKICLHALRCVVHVMS